jgi:GR25 family glycosyltransferase involved in LPS biosynthesis
VITVNDARKDAIQKQLDALKFPYPVHYFEGSTVENSTSWILEDYPVNKPLQCCTKSHIDALDWYVKNSLADYVLVLEDDAALLKDGFAARVDETIDIWSTKHSEDIDFVSIGYIPEPASKLMKELQSDESKTLYWGFKNVGSTLWGLQAYLVKRSAAFHMSHILQREKAEHVKHLLERFVKEGRYIANKQIYVQSDVVFALLFQQAFRYPLLAIETESVSTISKKVDRNWKVYEEAGLLKVDDYYNANPA